jgi:hypothetical protein
MTKAAYTAVYEMAQSLKVLGYLEGFETDLTVHDHRDIVGTNGPFIWAARAHGTWCLTREDYSRSGQTEEWRRSCHRCAEVLFEAHDKHVRVTHYRVFHWDGESLRSISRDQFVEIMRLWERMRVTR